MTRFLKSLAVFACLLVPYTASAQQNCASRATVLERLANGYGESRQSIGMAREGRVIEVFASLETGTWSITVTMPNGMTCLVASGDSFENLSEATPPRGKAS